MVDSKKHTKDVKQSNGRQLSQRRSGEDFARGNATRRDYPIQTVLTTHGKFRVIEKPRVVEAYTISLVSLSTPAVGGNIFTSCLKLLATSAHSEQRIRDYPTEIVVQPSHEGKPVFGTQVLVKRLILYKQDTSLLIKDNYHKDFFKLSNNCHIGSVSVFETNLSNIVMFATDNRKPCYLADENNQCDCRQFVEQISCERPCEKPCERICEKPCERICEKPCERICEKPCERICEKPCETLEKPCEKPCGELEVSLCPQSISNNANQIQVHVCMFCGQGFFGGNSCGRVCNESLKQKNSKNSKGSEKPQPKAKPKKKKIRFCGCLSKKEKPEEVKGCELKLNCDKTDRLFARMKKPSEVYIKNACMAKDHSLNIISCQKTLKLSEKKCEPMIQSCSPTIQQKPECQCQQCKPCPTKCISPCSKKTPSPCPSVCPDKPPRGYLPTSPCGYPLLPKEKHSPPYGYLVTSQENSNPPCENYSSGSQEKLNPPSGHLPCHQEKIIHTCGCNGAPLVSHHEKATLPCGCPPLCQGKALHNCKCYKDCLPKSSPKTQIYKSKSEKLVGKRFHLICQKFESSDEETDSAPGNHKSAPTDKANNMEARRLSSEESTELSEDIRNDYDEKDKTETKVGRVEIKYSKRYVPFKARLQRDNVPFKKRNLSPNIYSSSKLLKKYSMSSSNSNASYLNIGRNKIKGTKFPVEIEDCRSCYLKVCKHGNKKKTVFCYSSGCSVKEIS